MDTWSELWDAQNASLVATFSQGAALAIVQRSLADFGEESLESLVLTEEDGSDASPRVIASGTDLVKLARRGEPSLASAGHGEDRRSER